MRTEALFFKTLFLVFVAFCFSALMIWVFALIAITNHFSDTVIMLKAAFALSLVASIFFSPILLLISFIQWWIKSNKLKNTISFILMVFYGYIIFAWFSGSDEKFNWVITQDNAIFYFILSIPSTLIFMTLLFYLTQFPKIRKL